MKHAVQFQLIIRMIALQSVLVLAMLIAVIERAESMTVDHDPWDQFLSKYVSEFDDGVNRVAYSQVTASDKKSLKSYVKSLATTEVSSLTDKQAMAFWINLYNALTVDVVLDHYPVSSIRKIKPSLFSLGPWSKERITVEGEELSLDDIEHKKLRPVYKDPRIHYAVNCASFSCPNLLTKAFTARNLEKMLEQGAREYVNHPRGVWADEKGRVFVSSIYHWYREDFDDSDEGVLDHLRKYAEGETSAMLNGVSRIRGHDYDWSLNDAGKE